MKKAILIILLSPIYMFLEGIWERITRKDDDVEDYILDDYDNWGV